MLVFQIFSFFLVTDVAFAACPPLAFSVNSTTANRKLPNPFRFHNGDKVVTKADWECRRNEISALIQEYEFGNFPPTKPLVTAHYANTSMVINVNHGSKTISFTVKVNVPPGDGPFPAIIGLGGFSIPVRKNVATITFNNGEIGEQQGQSSRGRGKFFDLYGSRYPAGSLLAWTWGVSRIIDALELLGSSVTGIQETRLGVTGCSRNGKGALFTGAFEPRIALTIPQEAGEGGPALWRLWNDYRCRLRCIPMDPDYKTITENSWFRNEFAQYLSRPTTLPYDHHELMGLVAPRGLLLLENQIDWLQPENTVVGAEVARMIYETLGDKTGIGYVSPKSHSHCQFPADQLEYLDGFVDRFLHGKRVVTDVFLSAIKNDARKYIDWVAPKELSD